MMKKKIAALLAAVTVVTAWMPGLTLYAMEKEEMKSSLGNSGI
jgi:hypothetical protein